ncbi:methyl-accepting chemotaxis protein [Telmatospirillum siberiense]|uniref:Methyl-accepting chemotaxis protein n=1 Tax=Telmatospirillum siberiense TaxID=382514 RepID=A0A2N3PWW3_9PROT|nr:methyl-accepting chemotaxis protein [Telmatospirillum siberiense]PKU24904.1 methyl-accepting chemotaxis protein [Telmatospirillum siberiense]
MFGWWKNLTLRARFMVISGVGVLGMAVTATVAVAIVETNRMEAKLQHFSENELTSLNALVAAAHSQRRQDKAKISVAVFENWFERRNTDYPGKLWSVWGPKEVVYMAEEEPGRAPKKPLDAIDEEALRSGKPVGRFVGETYRYSMPILYGVSSGADSPSCHSCHGGLMEEKKGDVMGVFSSSLNTAAETAELRRIIIGMAVAAFLVTLSVVVVIKLLFERIVSLPLARMTGVMGRLATGDVAIDVPSLENRDETGDMARAVQVFKTNLLRQRELEEQQRSSFAAQQARAARLEELTASFDRDASQIVRGLASAASQLQASATTMSGTASETSQRASSVSAASEQASSNVQTVASAAEELSSSINEISRQVGHSSQITHAAVEEARKTETEVGQLAETAKRIGAVVALINDIASQTNLLALNATIEAARAGEAGKGFAVVAGEVKNLANQTAKATDEIGEQIAAVQGQTERVVAAIQGILKTIIEVGDIAGNIAAGVEQQTSATREIARNVEQAAAGTAEVSGNVTGVQAAADQSSRAAADLLSASDDLAAQSTRLKGIIDGFLKDVASN